LDVAPAQLASGTTVCPLVVTQELKNQLGDKLVAYYSEAQGRGFKHHVEHYTRANSAEYFFVYLDDYPDNKPAFDDSGGFNRRPGQSAFDNIFVYNPTDGTLDLFAQGGRKVHDELQKRFCGAVLGAQVEPAPPNRPVYQLDHLKNPAFAFPTEPHRPGAVRAAGGGDGAAGRQRGRPAGGHLPPAQDPAVEVRAVFPMARTDEATAAQWARRWARSWQRRVG
jgi:hypothetical protein